MELQIQDKTPGGPLNSLIGNKCAQIEIHSIPFTPPFAIYDEIKLKIQTRWFVDQKVLPRNEILTVLCTCILYVILKNCLFIENYCSPNACFSVYQLMFILFKISDARCQAWRHFYTVWVEFPCPNKIYRFKYRTEKERPND